MTDQTQLGTFGFLRHRWRQHVARRRLLRWWTSMSPGEQLGVFMRMFDETPDLRKQFRRSLHVRSAEDESRIVRPR